MAYVWQRWLADEFRAAGLDVIEVEGWENRGRPASTGNYNPQGPLTEHHTASTTSPTNPRPTLRLLIEGRLDLPGPLAPYSTGADGKVAVIAAGRCNHAGPIGRTGVLGMPYGADGNALAMGDEVDTNGTQDMPEVQKRAMATAAAVVLKHFDKTPAWLHRHADISGSGKWDLGSLTTTQVRELTAAAFTALSEEDPFMALTEKQQEQLVADVAAIKHTVTTVETARDKSEFARDAKRYRNVVTRLGSLEDDLEVSEAADDTEAKLRARVARLKGVVADLRVEVTALAPADTDTGTGTGA